jgi:hypothetical protein
MPQALPPVMPPEVERQLQFVLGYQNRPNPIDVYLAIRDALASGPPANSDGNPGAGGGGISTSR